MATTSTGATAVSATRGATARDVMTANPRTCSPFSTVTEAVMIFRDADCGAVPVVEDGRPVGVLTDLDVALAAAWTPDLPNRPVSEVMTRAVVAVPEDASRADVEAAFRDHDVRRLLVTGDDGRLVGIIAWTDLIPAWSSRAMGEVVRGVIGTEGDAAPEPAPARDDRPAPPAHIRATRNAGKGGRASLSLGTYWAILKQAGREWVVDKVPRLAAALSFYSMLSLAPLLLIAIAIAGAVVGTDVARHHLIDELGGLVGKDARKAIETVLEHANKPRTGAFSTVVGVIMLLVGASGVVGQLQDALNTVWEVAPKPGRGLWGFLKDRFLSMAMVLGVGFLLLVSLVLSTVLTALATSFSHLFAAQAAPALGVADFLVSTVVITLLFALIYKVVPDVQISWGDVRVGAAMTAVLFVVGKWLIGLYLGRSSMVSTYGAAGSLVVLLVWLYYSAQILFFGAEFTKAYADRLGTRIVPDKDAVPVTEDARAEQGIPKPEQVKAGAQRAGKA